MEPIITSLLDTDLYKISMGNAVFQLFPKANVEYKFINRGMTEFDTCFADFADRLREQIDYLCELEFAPDEIVFLEKSCPYLPRHYLEWLSGYRFDADEVFIGSIVEGGREILSLKIRGPWYRTILWEVPLMAIISELYFRIHPNSSMGVLGDEIQLRDIDKAKRMGVLAPYSDFGTRRRHSKANQERIVRIHKEHGGDNFQGTSNVLMAMKYGLKPIGTVAHEFIMYHGAIDGYQFANLTSLSDWRKVYGSDLGIALTDTYTSDVFFESLKGGLLVEFDGLRHDSGCPFKFVDKAVDAYTSIGVDPATKKIVFSDWLDVDKAEEIHKYCNGLVQDSYGIGTNFTNDVGADPLNMVIKMMAADPCGDNNWKPTVKLSDVEGKNTGDSDEVDRCKRLLRIGKE